MKKWIKRLALGVVCVVVMLVAVIGFIPQEFVYKHAIADTITNLTGITGQVGKEDINFGTGQATDTFTVTSSSGGSITLTKLPSLWANVASLIKGKWYVSNSTSITNHGDATKQGSLAWIIATISTDNAAIELPPGAYTVGSNLSVPSNVKLIFHPGAVITVSSGKVLTIGSQVEAGIYQIFNATDVGGVVISKPQTIYPEWFGVVPDDPATTYENEMARAIGAAASGSVIEFTQALYYFTHVNATNETACIRIDKPLTLLSRTGSVLKKAVHTSVRLIYVNKIAYYDTTMNDLTAYNIADPTAGAQTVTCSTAAEAGNFAADDYVVISTRTGRGGDTPFVYEFNEVESVDAVTGIITLKNSLRIWNDSSMNYEISNVNDLLVENVRIEGLKLDGNASGSQNIFALWAKNLQIVNCDSYNSYGPPINLQYVWGGLVENNRAHDSGFPQAGIDFTGCDNINVVNNESYRNLIGIFVDEDSGWMTFRGNRAWGNRAAGFRASSLWHSVIADNIFNGNGYYTSNCNLELRSCYKVNVSNNNACNPWNSGAPNMKFYYESGASPAEWQNAYHVISNNITSGGACGIALNYYIASVSTAPIYRTIVANNMCSDGIDAQYTQDMELIRNYGVVTSGNNKSLSINGQFSYMGPTYPYPSTSGTGEQTLGTVTLTTGTNVRYQGYHVKAGGIKTGGAGNKTIKFYIGSTSLIFNPANNDVEDWSFEAFIGPTNTAAYVSWNGGRTGSYSSAQHDIIAETMSGEITLKITGECANASDTISQTVFWVEGY